MGQLIIRYRKKNPEDRVYEKKIRIALSRDDKTAMLNSVIEEIELDGKTYNLSIK